MSKRDGEGREELRRRLLRLGLTRGDRAFSASDAQPVVAIQDVVDGEFHETPHGRCFVASSSFSVDHSHGDLTLGEFLDLPREVLATIGSEPTLAEADLTRSLFLDTETTGLSGGAGTMAFVVGLGFFEAGQFRLLQTFLRDPGDEPAMIHLLDDLLPQFDALVSFNGRVFDVPILQSRFVLARKPFPHKVLSAHLDLLPPSRRLWRMRLSSCALSMLEREVLGVQRDQADVPGGVIPYIYRDYLRTGDAREISRVLYHNQIDILSLVTLATRLVRTFTAPLDGGSVTGAELYCLARWYNQLEREAEAPLREALEDDLAYEVRQRVLRDLALLLKREKRREETIEWWQQLAVESASDIRAPVELAKIFEWHVPRLELAAGWTRLALSRAQRWSPGSRRERALDRLQHRLERLQRKMERSDD